MGVGPSMNLTHPPPNLPLEGRDSARRGGHRAQGANVSPDSYDYIIAGGGSAGCVLARRLSDDPSLKVLLIEAGGTDRHPLFHMPAGFAKMTKGIGSWGWHTVPQKQLNGRVLRYTQAKVIGGGSSINAQLYTRGVPADYDEWVSEEGALGWSYRDVLPVLQARREQPALRQRVPCLRRAARGVQPDQPAADLRSLLPGRPGAGHPVQSGLQRCAPGGSRLLPAHAVRTRGAHPPPPGT